MMKLTHARQKHTVMSLFISHCEPPIRNNQPGYNNHPHSHAVKLPDGRSGRSDFLAYHNFPEVYHAHGISKAVFSAPEDRVTGQGRDTTSSVMVSWEHRYILCCRAAARRRPESRSGTMSFRISAEMRREGQCYSNKIIT